MKIVFTSSYKTFIKKNTKNYTSNSYVLVFLISVIFFLLIIWDGGSISFLCVSPSKLYSLFILTNGDDHNSPFPSKVPHTLHLSNSQKKIVVNNTRKVLKCPHR